MMRKIIAAVALACPLIAFAQTPSGPEKGDDPLDKAKTSRYYLRYADEIRAKKNMEASHVALRTKAFKDALRTSPGASRLIVSNNVYNLPRMQSPFDPFAFGGTKVVPKPDRAFRGGDEVWLFAELRNPTVGDDRLPKLTTKIEIEGVGRKLRMPSDIAAFPLKGVDGHFGLGTTVSLTSLKPGEYKVRLTITDTLAGRDFAREETIKVTD